eukprot:1576518-Pyramimonas_sp.AAC.1
MDEKKDEAANTEGGSAADKKPEDAGPMQAAKGQDATPDRDRLDGDAGKQSGEMNKAGAKKGPSEVRVEVEVS